MLFWEIPSWEESYLDQGLTTSSNLPLYTRCFSSHCLFNFNFWLQISHLNIISHKNCICTLTKLISSNIWAKQSSSILSWINADWQLTFSALCRMHVHSANPEAFKFATNFMSEQPSWTFTFNLQSPSNITFIFPGWKRTAKRYSYIEYDTPCKWP